MSNQKLFLLCALLALSACADAPEQSAAASRRDTAGVAVIALQADLEYANVLVAGDRFTNEVLRYALFLPLVHYTAALDYQPALAESYTFEGDSAVTFKLRRDVYWHDGQHTTAHDVAFTFNRAADTATAFPNSDWLIGWGQPVVIDSFTVRFPLERMADPLASVALFPIMPRHLLEATPAAQLRQSPFNKNPVGNGPFRFVEYRAGDRWVLEANRAFPTALGGPPPLKRVVLRVIPDATAQAAELKAGNVDLALAIPVDQYQALDADPALRGIGRTTRQYAFVAWNTKRPGLSDPRVRRALTYAMDRPTMLAVVRKGHGELAASPIGRESWAFDSSLPPLPYNPDSARALLAAAGWGDGKLKIELKYGANSQTAAAIAEMVRSDLSKVGVQVTPRALEYNTLLSQITSPRREFDAVMQAWENDIRPNFRDMFHSAVLRGPFQFASYTNPEVDRIIDQASSEPDRAKAKPLWSRFQTIMREEQPWTVIFHLRDLYIARERLQGVQMDVRGAFVTMPQWWIQRDTLAR